MRHYCTYFDSNFLSRGLTLYNSLCTYEKEFTLYILCLDDKTHNFFQHNQFEYIIPIALQKFEAGDKKLTDCKANRSRVEYFFTCTPSLPLYIFNLYNDIELLTYLDSDLYFFSSPDPVFDEIADSSIAIIGHRFSERNMHFEANGIYNVGFISFKNNLEGRKCLEWWRNKCIDWCYDVVDSERFADQKYLDNWPILFTDVCIISHKGANLAPWNIDNYSYDFINNEFFIDGSPLIFYHFHGLGNVGKFFFRTGIEAFCDNNTHEVVLKIYQIYIRCLKIITGKYDIKIGATRYKHSHAVQSLIRLSVDSEVICDFQILPVFSMRRIVCKLLPIYKLFKIIQAYLKKDK
jgi:hypothetical protein